MYIDCWLYSKTCLNWPLKKEDQSLLNAGQKYCRMLQGEHSAIFLTIIKQPFVIKIFVMSFFKWLLKTGFTLVTTYFLFSGVGRHAVRWILLLKWDVFTTKKDGSTGPNAFEIEIMGQWPRPTINLKACTCMSLLRNTQIRKLYSIAGMYLCKNACAYNSACS